MAAGSETPVEDAGKIDIPAWVPPLVTHGVRRFEGMILTPDQHAALVRLATDERMKTVWNTLLNRDRRTQEFKYPGKPEGGWLPADWAQNAAMEQVFRDCYFSIKDRRRETTQEENETSRSDLLNKANMLREIAEDLAASNANSPVKVDAEVEALNRVAGWFEGNANLIRDAADPLTIKRHRLDPVVGGTLKDCEQAFMRSFGTPFRGLSELFVEVGTGLKIR